MTKRARTWEAPQTKSTGRTRDEIADELDKIADKQENASERQFWRETAILQRHGSRQYRVDGDDEASKKE